MRLGALETEDMLTQKATNKEREGDGDREGLLLEQKREAIRNHKSTSETAFPPHMHSSVADCQFSSHVNNYKQLFANWTNM